MIFYCKFQVYLYPCYALIQSYLLQFLTFSGLMESEK
jgi:hypothetical protein